MQCFFVFFSPGSNIQSWQGSQTVAFEKEKPVKGLIHDCVAGEFDDKMQFLCHPDFSARIY